MLLPMVRFDNDAQCFKVQGDDDTDGLVASMDRPLSLTFQLTRNCNFAASTAQSLPASVRAPCRKYWR